MEENKRELQIDEKKTLELNRKKTQDLPRVKEEIEKVKENRKKLEEMYKPYANYPKFDGTEIHKEELNNEIQEEYDIQMEELDDGEDT